jgi:hypothetical protein
MIAGTDNYTMAYVLDEAVKKGAFKGIEIVIDLDIPGLGKYEGCRMKIKGGAFERRKK